MSSMNPHYVGDPKSFEAFKENGKMVGRKFKPRGLNIVWGNDARYWNVPKPNVQKPAELLQVCWLEVTGSADIDLRKGYEVIFNLSLRPDAFGWGGCPVYVMVKRGKQGKFASKKYQLTSFDNSKPFEISCKLMKAIKENQEPTDAKLYFGLYEVWSGKWKAGLQIHNVIVKELPAN